MNLSFNESIVAKLTEVFKLSTEEIRSVTQHLEISFYEKLTTANEGFAEFRKPDSLHFLTEQEKLKWEAATLIGMDLPVMISAKAPSCKRVFIIGIDPLRKRKDFRSVKEEDVIVGTPYAVHSSFYREKGSRTKVYWNFICGLAQQYDVYLTDVFKLWMNDAAFGEGTKFPFDASIETWKTLLAFEIETIRPSAIFCFGNKATEICKNLGVEISNCKIIPLPHPSGRNSSWNSLIEGRCTVDAKVAYLLKQMERDGYYDLSGLTYPSVVFPF